MFWGRNIVIQEVNSGIAQGEGYEIYNFFLHARELIQIII